MSADLFVINVQFVATKINKGTELSIVRLICFFIYLRQSKGILNLISYGFFVSTKAKKYFSRCLTFNIPSSCSGKIIFLLIIF